jgi:protein SCO1/2
MTPLRTIVVLLSLVVGARLARAEPALPPALHGVGFDQRVNEQVPLDLAFHDETGQAVHLTDYFRGKPVILILAWYRCPMLCTEVLNGVTRAMLDMSLTAGPYFPMEGS